MKRIARTLLGVLFIAAGLNHFINPGFYLPLIPPYLPWHDFLNILSGVLEIVLGIGVLMPRFRRVSAIGIVGLMVLFIPAHVYMIQKGGCMSEELCAPAWGMWVRLLVIQPLLIGWAWWVRE